jgi:hypothetical protein
MPGSDTITETVTRLREEGYTEDFNLKQDCLECRNGQFMIFADEFKVDKFYRFEGMSDPADSSILYAISSDVYQLKGILINAYGIYSEPIVDQMLARLRTHA